MSTLARLLVLLALTIWPSTGHGPARLSFAADTALLGRASVMLGRVPGQAVVRYLRRQGVRSAVVGPDGQTVDVTFRNGTQGAILPSRPLHSTEPSPRLTMRSRVHVTADGRPRALVLEPFATELQLGAHPDDPMISDLTGLGYQVDQLYDTDVTVDTMATLYRYDLVYINSHSGVNPQGEGVLATGQPADPSHPDPRLEPLIKEYSLLIVGVAGTDQPYYGIISGYIHRYEDRFRPGTLVFINGCTFLRATAFWAALSDKGAGAMISWTDDVAPRPAVLAWRVAAADLTHGASVSGTVGDVMAEAYAMTNASGDPAHLGYLGDGSLTIPPFTSRTSPGPASTPTPSTSPSPTPTARPAVGTLPPGSWHATPADRRLPPCSPTQWGRGHPC